MFYEILFRKNIRLKTRVHTYSFYISISNTSMSFEPYLSNTSIFANTNIFANTRTYLTVMHAELVALALRVLGLSTPANMLLFANMFVFERHARIQQ